MSASTVAEGISQHRVYLSIGQRTQVPEAAYRETVADTSRGSLLSSHWWWSPPCRRMSARSCNTLDSYRWKEELRPQTHHSCYRSLTTLRTRVYADEAALYSVKASFDHRAESIR